jgi:hypothetical protein
MFATLATRTREKKLEKALVSTTHLLTSLSASGARGGEGLKPKEMGPAGSMAGSRSAREEEGAVSDIVSTDGAEEGGDPASEPPLDVATWRKDPDATEEITADCSLFMRQSNVRMS